VWSEKCKSYSSLPLVTAVSLFVSQSSDFCRHNPLCCFSTSVYCCSCLFRYRLIQENFWKHLHKSVGWPQVVRCQAKKLAICDSYRDSPTSLATYFSFLFHNHPTILLRETQLALCEYSAKGMSHLVSLIYDCCYLNRRAVTAQSV
jgi:hypothetical protein